MSQIGGADPFKAIPGKLKCMDVYHHALPWGRGAGPDPTGPDQRGRTRRGGERGPNPAEGAEGEENKIEAQSKEKSQFHNMLRTGLLGPVTTHMGPGDHMANHGQEHMHDY